MTLSEKIILLSATLWLTAIAFMAYTFILQSRFQTILKALWQKIDRIDRALSALNAPISAPSNQPTKMAHPSPKKETPETTIKIDKNEPLSKYETVTLPDEININFVDR